MRRNAPIARHHSKNSRAMSEYLLCTCTLESADYRRHKNVALLAPPKAALERIKPFDMSSNSDDIGIDATSTPGTALNPCEGSFGKTSACAARS